MCMSDSLHKLYIEPSTLCNLDCQMCMRKTWRTEQMGHMDFGLYEKLIDEIRTVDSIHTVFFGGIGEPMAHPRFEDMVRLAAEAGKRVECVTNATMLDLETAKRLREAGMRMVWTSVDGFDKKTYDEIRQNSDYDVVAQNILSLREYREIPPGSDLGVGLTFVAMKDNIDQIPALMMFAARAAISAVRITNVLPYTPDMIEQALYRDMLQRDRFYVRQDDQPIDGVPYMTHVDFPPMDLNEETVPQLTKLLSMPVTFSMMDEPVGRKRNYCKFVREGNVFVRWDGKVSPCMALIHESETYLHGRKRDITPKFFGNVQEASLMDIWQNDEFTAFREKVTKFDFSFCTYCGGCERMERNDEDCFGNEHPTCGACLWAQGFVQCP